MEIDVSEASSAAKDKLRALLSQRQEREKAALLAELQARHVREMAALEADEDPDLVRVECGREHLKTILGDCPSAHALSIGDAAWTALQRSYLKPLQELRQENEREANAKGKRLAASHPLNTQAGAVMNEEWLAELEAWETAKKDAEVEAAARKEIKDQATQSAATERATAGTPLVAEHVDTAAAVVGNLDTKVQAAMDALEANCIKLQLVQVLFALTPNPKVSGNRPQLLDRLKPLVKARLMMVEAKAAAASGSGAAQPPQTGQAAPANGSAGSGGVGGDGGS